ncbi:MAG: NUDIX hydrolase [Patescibacteria group bacterium]
MELQVGVKILLKNSEGKYLFVRRNPKVYPEVGAKWDIVGGRIEAGTPLIENLKREIKEEVGLDYVGEPKLVAAQDILIDHKYTNGTNNTNQSKHVVRLTYIGFLEGHLKVNDDHTEAAWFTVEEIKKLEPMDSYFAELAEKGII